MKAENLREFTDQQLIQKKKDLKTHKIIDATIIGITIGVFVYSLVKNGFGLFMFFPLVIGYQIFRNSSNNKILEREILKEIKSRNLE